MKGMMPKNPRRKHSRRKYKTSFLQNSGEKNIHKQDPKSEVIK